MSCSAAETLYAFNVNYVYQKFMKKQTRRSKKKGPSPKHFSKKAKKTAFPILAYVLCVCGQDRLKDKRRPR